MKIYAFLGRKRSGKDTAANILNNNIGNGTNAIYMSFAGPIKDALVELTGSPREYFHDQSYKEKKVIKFGDVEYTPRELMIWYGTLIRKKFGEDFWLNKVKEQLQNLDGKYEYVFITDVRFLIETKMLNELGATIVYMNRDEVLGPLPENADVSETVVATSRDWAKVNAKNFIEISNNSTFGCLVMKIKHYLTSN